MTERDWHTPHARALMMRLDGRSPHSGLQQPGSDVTLLLLINAAVEDVVFQLPPANGGRWTVQLDTADESGQPGGPVAAEQVDVEQVDAEQWTAMGCSLALLALLALEMAA